MDTVAGSGSTAPRDEGPRSILLSPSFVARPTVPRSPRDAILGSLPSVSGVIVFHPFAIRSPIT